MSTALISAVLNLSADTGRTMDVLRHVGAMERATFLATLKPLNLARWAVITHRLATDPRYVGEVSPEDADQARRLARALLREVAA